jgi:hypothetical protein
MAQSQVWTMGCSKQSIILFQIPEPLMVVGARAGFLVRGPARPLGRKVDQKLSKEPAALG